MRKIVSCIAVVILFSVNAYAGFRLVEENDFFAGESMNDDKYYSQGLEIDYVRDVQSNGNNQVFRQIYGLRNLMYTPTDIAISDPQPDEHPWAGMMAVTYTEWTMNGSATEMWEYLFGVTGPWSRTDKIQTWVHKVIGSHRPAGWSNQIPNEVVFNVTYDNYKLLTSTGKSNGWAADLTQVYGFSLGNAFVNGEFGYLGRAGWNVPSDYEGGTILKPTLSPKGKVAAYAFAGVTGRAVLHNITLGGSLFQDGPYLDLKPFVVDSKAGLAFRSYRVFGSDYDFDLSYAFVCRSMEWYGQDELTTFGSITIGITGGF